MVKDKMGYYLHMQKDSVNSLYINFSQRDDSLVPGGSLMISYPVLFSTKFWSQKSVRRNQHYCNVTYVYRLFGIKMLFQKTIVIKICQNNSF